MSIMKWKVSLVAGVLSVFISGLTHASEAHEWAFCSGFVFVSSQELEGFLPQTRGDARRDIEATVAHLNSASSTMSLNAMGAVFATGVEDMNAIVERIKPSLDEGQQEAKRLIGDEPLSVLDQSREVNRVLMNCLRKDSG